MRISLRLWLFLIPLVRVFFCSDVVLVSGQCQSDQQFLLLQLKNNLVFDSSLSKKLVNWNQSADSWDGVTCEEGRVTGLDLSHESISGGVENSSALFGFQHLQSLNLAFNVFNGTQISPRFGSLTNLSYLNLSNAGFAGQIPIQISHLASLVTLDLSAFLPGIRSLKLEYPNLMMLIQNLAKLEELHLDGVNISARGNEWGQALSSSLPNLRVLSLSNCNLSGPINSSLHMLKYLSVIRLDKNNFSAPVPDFFANFSNLTFLYLSSCEFHGIFPKQIFQVSTLQTLDLSANPMLQGFLPEFSQNGSLRTLLLRYTNFSGTLPESIGKLKMLSKIELQGCNFNGTIPNLMPNLTLLDFSCNSFVGPMPSFSLSTNLKQLNLAHNQLNGSIDSTAWEGLSNLVILDLRNNSFSGSIPFSLFKIPSLQKIQLSLNKFTGKLNASTDLISSMLDTLDLSSNELQGQFPTFVFRLQGLKILALSSNNFSGTVEMDMIGTLKNLSTLDLSYNNLSINASGADSTLTSFPKVRTLKLASCNLGTFPDFLKNQSNLSVLDLSDNHIQGNIPIWIWKLGSLSSLNLSDNLLVNAEGPPQNITSSLFLLDLHSNMLQGRIPIISKLAFYLDYSSNNFSSAIPDDVGDYLTSTIFFSLSNNNFHGSIPPSICKAKYLQVLDLSNNDLSGVIPQCLTWMTTLGVLNIRNNSLNGNISDTFGNCALQTLDVNGNLLEGMLPKSLANCRMLEVLDLGNNNIHDSFPCYLKSISNLRVLVLRSNKFSGSINCSGNYTSWPKLQIVDLAFNNFNGTLPNKCLQTWTAMGADEDDAQAKLKHLRFEVLRYTPVYYQDTVTVTSKGLQLELVKILTLFTSIDLSCNNFQGPIPDVIGEFTSLYVLNLSHNALTGQIPSSIGNLKQLESLDLSRNQLNGEIPVQLASLNFLSVLDLSFNQLVGKIPKSTQLQSFSNASFQGNAGLCGSPLADNCTNSNISPAAAPKYQYTGWTEEFDWQFIFTGLGFGVGAAVVITPLAFWKKGRKWYDECVDQILIAILPMLGLVYRSREEWKLAAEENIEEDRSDITDDDNHDDEVVMEDEEFCGSYCVFCSKLDIYRKRVMHDPKCTCHHSPTISSSSSSSSSSLLH